jgi:hypothetical protein
MPKLLAPVALVVLLAPAAAIADDGPPSATPIVEEAPCAHARWQQHRGHLAIGFAGGRVETDDEREGTQRSLIVRLTGRRGWAVELELSKLRLGDDEGRTAGGAIVKAFGRRRLAPYVVAGAGGGRLDRADGAEAHVRFAELGGGLMLRGRRLSIGAEVRRGMRRVDAGDPVAMDSVAERAVMSASDDGERYTRGRIVALVHF